MARKGRKHDKVKGSGVTRLPRELATPIATTADGRDITRPWVGELQQPRDRRLWGAVDWGVYKRILSDDQVKSTLQQRIGAVVSRDWDVLPGDEKDPRSVAAADALTANLERIGWDRKTEKMLMAVFNGISVGELIWAPRDGFMQFDIKIRHARRFRFDNDDRLRLLTRADMQRGELLPERKFWVVTAGADNDDEPYGHGLADWLYWPTLFKRNGIRFWNTFLDKFGTPTAKGTYRRGTPQKDIDAFLEALQAIATDSGFVIPEGMAVELLTAAKSGTADFENLCRYMDEAIAKVILSQTMTTQDGASLSQAQVHAGVKLEVIKSDADLLSDSFNGGPSRWWTDINFGVDVAAPRVIRLVEEEEDTKATAETDKLLDEIGWERTEESFKDTYGDGYVRKAPAEPVAGKEPGLGHNGGPAIDDSALEKDTNVVPFKSLSFASLDPAPLYVYRRLLNADDLISWAKKAGFTSIVAAGDMHVTQAYSRRPVDWLKMGGRWGPPTGELIVPAGGARIVTPLGDQGAVVLAFGSDDLTYRHREMAEAGASWDHPEYRPHITFSYDAGDIDLDAVEPYRGQLKFGPEIFEPIEEGWSPRTVAFAEMSNRDVVDRVVDQLIADSGFSPLTPIMAPIADAIARSGSADELDAELIASLDQADVDKLVQSIERAGFAVRLAAEIGAEEEE